MYIIQSDGEGSSQWWTQCCVIQTYSFNSQGCQAVRLHQHHLSHHAHQPHQAVLSPPADLPDQDFPIRKSHTHTKQVDINCRDIQKSNICASFLSNVLIPIFGNNITITQKTQQY